MKSNPIWLTMSQMLPTAMWRNAALIAALGLASSTALAQADFEKGFQAYQSYHGSDFDTVNLANGNLILDIPLLSYEQRGGLPPVTISIRSNATTFQSTPPFVNGPLDTKQHEVASGVIGAPWGQPHVAIDPGGLSWKEDRITTASHVAGGGPEYLTRFVAIDESGATHSLGGSVANQVVGIAPGIRYSVDGSGLMLQPGTAQTGPVILDRKGNIGGLIDVNGNTITLNGLCATAPGGGELFDPSLSSWEVYAHGTASATSITDSIGRTPIPNPSHLPPVGPYTCLVDLDASYHPASPDVNGCETFQFPAEGSGTVPLTFCYAQLSVSASIPVPSGVGTPVSTGGANTAACTPAIPQSGNNISCETINETWWVLTSVTLPNQTQWLFSYDNYGQVQSITMPTGATVSYEYRTRLACGNPPGETPVTGTPVWPYSNLMSSRMVVKRTLDVKDGSVPKIWTYSSDIGSGWASSPNAGTVDVLDPESNKTTHVFSLIGGSVCGPYETQTRYYQGLSALIKEIDTSYSNTGTDYANPTNFSNYISIGVLPQTVNTTLLAASGFQVSQQIYSYDSTFGSYQDYVGITHPFSFGLLLAESESDWAAESGTGAGLILSGATLPPLRTTLHTYAWQSNWSYFAANLINLPCLETIFSGTAPGLQPSCNPLSATTNQLSQTSYEYDEGSPYSYTGSLGNLTTVNRWLRGSTNAVMTHSAYTLASHGMPTWKSDADGYQTLFSYDTSGLYLQEIQHPVTYTNGQSVSHIEYPSYDDNTGLLMSSRDENLQPTLYQYDAMRRLRNISFPDGGWETYTYTDTTPHPSFVFQKGLSQAQTYSAVGIADGLGRIQQTQITSVPVMESPIIKDTAYDDLGRVASVSNPYRNTSESTYGTTSYLYDALGRKIYECQQDNIQTYPQLCVPSNSYLQWVYSGNSITSYDELHNAWLRTTDALGRLTQVIEPDGLYTTYAYDALGNLTCADQWGAGTVSQPCTSSHARSFAYDSLSRLITSSNPEAGTICYGQESGGNCTNGYDPNGNLLYKTEAHGALTSPTYTVTHYTYDALNRLLSKSYANDATGTPASCYQYDLSTLAGTSANMKGRLAHAWTQAGACSTSTPAIPSSTTLTRRSILGYDAMGRILSEQQCTLANCKTTSPYTMAYDYDLAGNLLHHSNGIGTITFTNCYDSVGRLQLVASVSVPCAAPTYLPSMGLFTSPTYSPAGGLTSAAFGTGLQLARTYDSRLRIHSENDTGNSLLQSATPGSVAVQILGNTDHTH